MEKCVASTEWGAAAQRLLPDMVSLRRAIHADPEIGLHNPRTTAKVLEAIADLPLEIRQGSSTTGLVARLRGARPGRRVLLRGDMDALPMQEQTGAPFASKFDGVMHACGHDAHTAMLAAAARLLASRRDTLSGEVLFMFQPGEEGHHGARFMIEDGLLDPLPDAAFALHVMPNAPHGVFTGRAGPTLASSDTVRARISGRGGHASMPHDAQDPIPVACAAVQALQTVVTRQFSVFDPVVISITKIQAGTTRNVIPDDANLLGTIRALSPAARAASWKATRAAIEGIARAHGLAAEVEIEEGFPVTVSDRRVVELARAAAVDLFGAGAWRDMASPVMGAEDFSYVLEKVPGAMLFLGAAAEGEDWTQCCGLHSARMSLDEQVMARGAALHASVAERFLESGLTA
jgi:hippurate hydrolase